MNYKTLLFPLLLSNCVYAWECPVCKKSFASMGFVSHDCCQEAIPAQLTDLISASGFSFYPSSKANALSTIGEYLEYLPLEENKPDLPWDIRQWLYNWFGELDLCEHGTSITFAFTTPHGESIREKIEDYKTTVISEEEFEASGDSGDHQIVIESFMDWYYYTAGMCGCGNKEEVFALFHDALLFFQENIDPEKPYDKFPVADSKVRKCFISWLVHQKLLTAKLDITSFGLQILSFLKPGYPGYFYNPGCGPDSDESDSDESDSDESDGDEPDGDEPDSNELDSNELDSGFSLG